MEGEISLSGKKRFCAGLLDARTAGEAMVSDRGSSLLFEAGVGEHTSDKGLNGNILIDRFR